MPSLPNVVYDKLFTTTFGALTDTMFDADLWNSLITLCGEENALDPADLHNPQVLTPAADLFDSFRSANGESIADDPVSEVVVDSVPEGDGTFLPDDKDETFSTTSTQVTSNQSPEPYHTRSGRVSKRHEDYEPAHTVQCQAARTGSCSHSSDLCSHKATPTCSSI